MNPKEKAKELVDKYLLIEDTFKVDLFCDECGMSEEAAKYCVILLINEVIDTSRINMVESYNEDWWNKVKTEIEKL